MKASRKVVSARQRSQASGLRRSLTPAERRLWYALRARVPVDGSHFRRQVPIGAHIVDFCCHRARLVVEVDGNQHGFATELQRDQVRTITLEGEGYRVLRFCNEEVWRNLEAVLETIFAVVAQRTGSPSPYRAEDVSVGTKSCKTSAS